LLVAGDETDYLPLSGGDLTGNLTFDTDKIVLGVAGSGTFAGAMEALYFTANRTSGGNTVLQGYLNSVETSKVDATGNATFASSIQIGSTSANAANPGGFMYTSRYVDSSNVGSSGLCTVDGGELMGLQVINRVGTAVATASIAMDGAATFAGDITCSNNTKGLVLKSPNGTSYRLSAANDGTLSTSAV
jgi:hypothetical protein